MANPIPAISLRPACEADLPQLLILWQAAMSPHFRAAGLSSKAENPERRLRMNFAMASIILHSKQLIGMLKLDRTTHPCWQLVQLLLAPEAQGKGLGTTLLYALIAEAKSCGAGVQLSVLKGNPAKKLYERIGFMTVAEEPHAWNMRFDPNHIATCARL